MPRTIYQRNEQTYIGDNVLCVQRDNPPVKVPVYDRELNDWIQLNVGDLQVDYVIRDVTHTQATVTWDVHYDYQSIRMYLTSPGLPEKAFAFNPALKRAVLTGLKERTTYTLNVLAELPWGVSESNRQTFTTTHNPVPSAPLNLRHTARTNSSIALAWNGVTHAVSYAVYRAVGNGGFQRVATVAALRATISLKQDTKYRFAVRALNAEGQASPYSNIIKSATGHDAKTTRGSVKNLVLPPLRWGSWRSDIGWNWWYTWPDKDANKAIYQGYWEYPHKKYWGVIEYDPARLREIINKRFGAGTAQNLTVTEAAIKRVYRQRMPGNVAPQQLEWHLTNTKVRSANAKPSVFGKHVNNSNSADSRAAHRAIGAGQAIDMLRIPRAWGKAIILGKQGSTNVRGLVLHRGDSQNNGYGYAGYCKISGHKQPDYHLGGGGGRMSDLSLVIDANWNYTTTGYKAPYNW